MKASAHIRSLRRMLTPAEAALYVGLPLKSFRALCPAAPMDLGVGKPWYDKRDLDCWIDDLKQGGAANSREEILDRLG